MNSEHDGWVEGPDTEYSHRLTEGTWTWDRSDSRFIETDWTISEESPNQGFRISDTTKVLYSKRIWVHGRELSEYEKYLLDVSQYDYMRSLPEYRAHIRAKRRRKIERRQKRAAFRRRKRGLA